MKKTILRIFTYAIFSTVITSCAKDVKAPITKNSSNTKVITPSTNTGTQNTHPDGHTCGNHTTSYGSGGGY